MGVSSKRRLFVGISFARPLNDKTFFHGRGEQMIFCSLQMAHHEQEFFI
jgi:hypothetical protein